MAVTAAQSNQKVIPVSVPVTPKKSPASPGFGVQLLTAGTAACIADLWTFPLDTVKVRLQVRKF